MHRLVVLAILLAGCSQSAKPSRSAVARKPYQSEWHPPAPAPKPPSAPVKPAPPPPAPPDPAAEARRAETARKQDEERRRRAREREFAKLPSPEKRRLSMTHDALSAKKVDQLSDDELAVISHYPRQFPTIKPEELTNALALSGDRKGAREHLAKLGISDPDTALQVRAAFGLAPEATCNEARAAADEIGRLGLEGSSERVRAFVARNPKLFPQPQDEDSADSP
jgi:hypothetical protein